MVYVLPIVAGYLLGSISFSFLIGKWIKGIDIRNHGSGNAGATNTLRVLGKGPAVFVLLLDVLKGVVAVLISYWIAPDVNWVHAAAGLASIIGHNWPIYFGFRGGKGIATTIGVTITLVPIPVIIAGVVAIVSIVITRYVSLGSLLFTGLLPFVTAAFHSVDAIFWMTIVLAVLAYLRHRSNIVKILNRTENKIGGRK